MCLLAGMTLFKHKDVLPELRYLVLASRQPQKFELYVLYADDLALMDG